MNKQPVYYMQTDSRWKSKRYPCVGGTMSIGGGGCGETSAAMLLSTLTGKNILPTDTMEWACKRGYVIAEQGTTYSYFKPQFAAYGIDCDILTWDKCLDKNSPVRQKAIKAVQDGYYLIALMKKGLWTNGGHYIVVWWSDNKIRINDPASKRTKRLNGDPDTFFAQAKYFWAVDARKFNKKEDDDEMMSGEQIVNAINEYYANASVPEWAKKELKEAIDLGITDGTRPMQFIPRYQAAIMAKRAAEAVMKR